MPSFPNLVFKDRFSSIYSLTDLQTSPDGKWVCAFTGFGTVETRFEPGFRKYYMYEIPQISTGEFETHASMVRTAVTDFGLDSFEITCKMKTIAQTRVGAVGGPNPWETAWLLWNFSDNYHYYAFTLKTNGYQLEKKDNMINDDTAEIFLVTGGSPTVQLGKWHDVKVRQTGNTSGNRIFNIWVDGVQVITNYQDVIADDNPTLMRKGAVGLYNEDAEVGFDDVRLAWVKP